MLISQDQLNALGHGYSLLVVVKKHPIPVYSEPHTLNLGRNVFYVKIDDVCFLLDRTPIPNAVRSHSIACVASFGTGFVDSVDIKLFARLIDAV